MVEETWIFRAAVGWGYGGKKNQKKATEELVVSKRALPNHLPSEGSQSRDGAVRKCGLRLRDLEEL